MIIIAGTVEVDPDQRDAAEIRVDQNIAGREVPVQDPGSVHTFQNLSHRASVTFEVESGSVLRCRNSTVLGKSWGVIMSLEGHIEIYDSSLTSEPLGGGQGLLSSRGGNLTLENTILTRYNILGIEVINYRITRCSTTW